MYGQQFMPQFNPAGYQPQQYPAFNQQPAMQMQQMRGRVVSGEQDIQPSDVSMDGSRSYFPTQDGSAIYVRQVDSNLRMHAVKYVPEVQQEAPDVNEAIAELRSQVQALNLAASQQNQNAYLIGQLKMPTPVPSYTVPNPYAAYGCCGACC